MTVRHLITRSATAALVALALVVGLTALLPGELDAKVRCFCPPETSESARGWGMSPTSCAAAKAVCVADAQSIAQTDCDDTYGTSVCAWGDVRYVQSTCNFSGGMYKIDCYQDFACEQCIDVSFP